jgi:hypothetical protein
VDDQALDLRGEQVKKLTFDRGRVEHVDLFGEFDEHAGRHQTAGKRILHEQVSRA